MKLNVIRVRMIGRACVVYLDGLWVADYQMEAPSRIDQAQAKADVIRKAMNFAADVQARYEREYNSPREIVAAL